MACRTGCPTQDHTSWGECARAAHFQFTDIRAHAAAKANDKELAAYKEARRQGIQPQGTRLFQTEAAVQASDAAGAAWRSDTNSFKS